MSPFHVDRKKGVMLKGAISVAETSGLSVLREEQATDQEIRHTAETLVMKARAANNPKAGVYGVAKFTCKMVRKFRYYLDFNTSYCVYDTALANSRAHAEVFQKIHGVEKTVVEERRRLLLSDLNLLGVVEVACYRNGLLSYLAPP